MKVLLLPKYSRLGASSRLRLLQYIPSLEGAGFDVSVSGLLDDLYLERLYSKQPISRLHVLKCYFKRFAVLLRFYNYDIIWVEKELFPFLPAWVEFFLGKTRVKVIADYDDAVFHNYDMSRSSLVRKLLGRKIDHVMKFASCVTAGNQYLASRATDAGAQCVAIVPTVVDHTRYALKEHCDEGRVPVIGWMGAPSTQQYVVDIYQSLLEVCGAGKARLFLVGATEDIKKSLPGIEVQVAPWTEENEAHLITMMDIGIMPLKDGPWECGKCGYKLIQYMATGVPVVASDVGVNHSIVTGSESGFLASTRSEWVNSLRALIDSPTLRAEKGASGRASVLSKYSLQVQSAAVVRLAKDLPRNNTIEK